MRRAAALLAGLALGLGGAAVAQDAADKTRLDEFAVPTAADGQPVQQLDPSADPIVPAAAPVADRQLSIPAPPAAERQPVAQLSQTGETVPAEQLSGSAESREVAAGSVSSSRDSRPQPVAALGGSDRCEPGSEAEESEECRRILELRAAEFQAVEPPRLSAEQVLLAETLRQEEVLAAGSSRLRVRLAGAHSPDADLESNQELASIYLGRPADQSPAPLEEEPVPEAEALAEVLQGLQLQVSPSPAP